jgi:hypothetical protein
VASNTSIRSYNANRAAASKGALNNNLPICGHVKSQLRPFSNSTAAKSEGISKYESSKYAPNAPLFEI